MARHTKKVVFIAAGALLLGIGALGYLSGSPISKGPRIVAYHAPRSALLVVDLQEDYTGPQARQPYPDPERLLAASNALITQAQAEGTLVVFIENVLDNPILKWVTGGLNAPGAPGTEMDRRLLRPEGTRTFIKNASDAFSNPEFATYLRENQVDHVLIAGLDGRICVNATALGALSRGYRVTLCTQAIAVRNGKPLDQLARRWREAGAEVK